MESEKFVDKTAEEGLHLPSAAAELSLRQKNLRDWRQTRAFTSVQAVPKQDFS